MVLAKMDNAGTRSVVDSFSAVLNRQPAALRKSMTYDQGREMHGHQILTERTGVRPEINADFGKRNRMPGKAASAPQCEHCKHKPMQ